MTATNDLEQVARKLDTNLRRTARGIGRDVQKIALATVRPATGGDGALSSGGKRKPRRLRTRTQIHTRGTDIPVVVVWGVPAGPWRWMNDGTAAHQIRRRRKGPRAKMTVDHPGMSGYGSWDETRVIVARVIPGRFLEAASAAVKSLGSG